MKEQWSSDKWWVSYLNFVDDVRGSLRLPKNVVIHDITLRDGEQQAGLVFNKENKIKIATMLDEVGVHRIEAGMPAVSGEDKEAVKAIRDSIIDKLKKVGLELSTVEVDKIPEQVKEESIKRKSPISDEVFEEILKK